jgi:hypothetical protein
MCMADKSSREQQQVVSFLAKVFDLPQEEFEQLGTEPEGVAPLMSGVLRLQNQPEFWVDAPWRLEPDQDSIPVSFHLRDANLQPPGRGPWRLDVLRIDQQLPGGSWLKLVALLPADLPHVDEQGFSLCDFWVHGTSIPLSLLHGAVRGQKVHLRGLFFGSFAPYDQPSNVEVHLEVFLATEGLPQGREAAGLAPREWFYGDAHYHSAYTNDLKEFGGAVLEARRAGRAVGLDWLVVTDHSTDLGEVDAGHGGRRRWERLVDDIASPSVSDADFRCILGEEITFLGAKGWPLHLLALGDMADMIEGAFLPAESKAPEMVLARRALETIIRAGSGYAADIPERLFGNVLPLEEVMARLPAGTLTFAAHPYDVAQVPPARWSRADLTHPRLTGYQAWNGRIRATARMTANPFARWTDAAALAKADDARIRKLQERVEEQWDPQLQRGVRGWRVRQELPAWRPVLIAGADAHCDFNYHVGWAWDYRRFEVDDNALGRARTAVLLPGQAVAGVPPVDEILGAVKRGACLVTDGPLVDFCLEQDGRVARLGDLLHVRGPHPVSLRVIAHSTAEFGPVTEVEVVSFWHGQKERKPRHTVVKVGEKVLLKLEGRKGYCRLQARSAGPEGQGYCCFTNPIWLRVADGQERHIELSFS